MRFLLPFFDALFAAAPDEPVGEWRLLCAGEDDPLRRRTAREWAETGGLAIATNAGMFATDSRTHLGYLRDGDHLNSGGINDYQSVLAFGPRSGGDPRAWIFDLDVTPIDRILERYDAVVQNLRLVERPGANRWSPQPKKWSEAALGQDGDGRILFLFSRVPFSMHDLNRILLRLPIDLRCAQHLEGGPEGQPYARIGGWELELTGSYETGFNENDDLHRPWPIPNVLGTVPRKAEATD